MSLILDITDETGRVPEDQLAEIEKILQFAAAEEGVADGAEVSVTIVNNEEIQKSTKSTEAKIIRLMSFHLPLKKTAKERLKLSALTCRPFSEISSSALIKHGNRPKNTGIH